MIASLNSPHRQHREADVSDELHGCCLQGEEGVVRRRILRTCLARPSDGQIVDHISGETKSSVWLKYSPEKWIGGGTKWVEWTHQNNKDTRWACRSTLARPMSSTLITQHKNTKTNVSVMCSRHARAGKKRGVECVLDQKCSWNQ